MLGKHKNGKIILIFILAFTALLVAGFVYTRLDKKLNTNDNSGELYRIGFITDVHGFRTKKENYDITWKARIPLLNFVEHMNEKFKPDVVVECGDFIQGSFRRGQKSIDDLNLLLEYFNKLNMPAYHVMGNHETRGLEKSEWREILGYQSNYYSFEIDRLIGIVLDGNDEKDEKYANLPPGSSYYFISEKQLKWLEDTLKNAGNKNMLPVVFIHFPILDKLYKKGGEKRIYPEHSKKLIELFEKYGALAVFSGHMEDVYYEKINGVEYFVLPGFYKTMDDDNGEDNQEGAEQDWIGSFSEIYVFEDNIRVRLFYKKDFEDDYKKIWIPEEGENYSID